jgi:hypothetical protein
MFSFVSWMFLPRIRPAKEIERRHLRVVHEPSLMQALG